AVDGGLLDDLDPDAMRQAVARPDAFLAGWAHYVAFDVFVGRWIWRTALTERRGCRVALLLTMLFGPAGLLLFLAQRRLRPHGS
ncbi:MAG TPA: abscisic acid-deficient protein Aba4 family protein, partial [Euzebyales bacterium]|nr:abscisic acid-deficient protein Aba4 family protein [Euzebyales bacterium]